MEQAGLIPSAFANSSCHNFLCHAQAQSSFARCGAKHAVVCVVVCALGLEWRNLVRCEHITRGLRMGRKRAWHSMYKIQKIDYVPHPIRTQNKLAQHTTPIAKTHRTATLFSSEPTKNLKMFISIHHRNITISSRSPQHHHPSLRHHSITDTEQRHHQHKTKASPTYHQNITTQSLHITETRPRHHRHII